MNKSYLLVEHPSQLLREEVCLQSNSGGLRRRLLPTKRQLRLARRFARLRLIDSRPWWNDTLQGLNDHSQ
jgi:hypothetical protein